MDFKKILNITALVSAVLLMGVDVYYLSTLFSGSTGGQTFQTIMWTSTPCALLCGGTYLLYAGQKRAARPAAVCTLIVNAFYFLVRLFALILQITDVLNGRAETTTSEILALVEFSAYLVLLAANILLMLYLLTGRLRVAVQAVFSVAFIALIITWGIILKNAISSFVNGGGSGVGNFFKQNALQFNAGFYLSLLSAFAYLFLFGGVTKAFEGKKAKTQTPGLANGAVKPPAKGFNKGKKNG